MRTIRHLTVCLLLVTASLLCFAKTKDTQIRKDICRTDPIYLSEGLNEIHRFSWRWPQDARDYVAIKSISDISLVFENGTEVPPSLVYIHHIVSQVNYPKPARGVIWERAANTQQFSVNRLPDPYRLVLSRKELESPLIQHIASLASFSEEQLIVYGQWQMEWSPDWEDEVRLITPRHVHHHFEVPGGKGADSIWTESVRFVMPRNTTVLHIYSHLHQGGYKASLRRENGEMICDSLGIYGNTSCTHDCGGETCARKSSVHRKALIDNVQCRFPAGAMKLYQGETIYADVVYSNECYYLSDTMSCWWLWTWDGQIGYEPGYLFRTPSTLNFDSNSVATGLHSHTHIH